MVGTTNLLTVDSYQNWLKTTLLFSVEGVSEEVSGICTTASITIWVIQCILAVCNVVEDTKLQEVSST